MLRKDKMYLFVYGSLPPYLQDHHDIKSLGFAKTIDKFFMYVLGDKFTFPAIQKGGDYEALGTLYSINKTLIGELDMYEGSPDFFKREPVKIQNISQFFDFPKEKELLNTIVVYTYVFQDDISKYPAKRIR